TFQNKGTFIYVKKEKNKSKKELTREQELEKENELLRVENAYFKKAPSFRDRHTESPAKTESRIITELRKEFRLAVILKAINFPKATYMYWQKRLSESDPDEEIEKEIKQISEEHQGNYGYRRITMEIRKRGYIINHKKVLSIRRKIQLTCKKFTRKSRKYSSYKGKKGKVSTNRINRRFNTPYPLQKITTDTTELKYYTRDKDNKTVIKKAYLDPYLDMFNGEILSYRLSKKPNAKAVLDGLNEVIKKIKAAPFRTTIHTDQGWAYQMKAFTKKLINNNIFQSMSRRGNCLDNSPMENFFGIMKQEMYYGIVYESFEALQHAVREYIYYYNHK